jgi:zinc transporter ZupT
MNIFWATIILTAGIALFVAIPFLFKNIKNYSSYLFLLGTGAMLSICLFDLIPDVIELGGYSSLYIIVCVGIIYSVVHFFHIRHHGDQGHVHTQAVSLFFSSLIAHNFASGMLLAISYEVSQKIAQTVFMALVAHKGYEALMLSSMFVDQKEKNLKNIMLILIYIVAFPAGVILTYLSRANFNEQLAVIISSIAIGTLLGCLIFDFLVPSFKQLKVKRLQVLWLFAGFFLTQILDFYNS